MAQCKIAMECWFYQKELDPQSQAFELLQQYCQGAFADCARYRFAETLGARLVPRGLLPNEIRQIIPVIYSFIE
jgi:hypothetical protein